MCWAGWSSRTSAFPPSEQAPRPAMGRGAGVGVSLSRPTGRITVPSLNRLIFIAAAIGVLIGWLLGLMQEDAGLRSGVLYGSTLVDRKSTRLNSSHVKSSYAVFCLKKKI